MSAALTRVGECSSFVPYMSEYTALKSSGRLSIVAEPTIREGIVSYYEVDDFYRSMHAQDCELSNQLMDSLLGKVDLAETAGARNSGANSGANGGANSGAKSGAAAGADTETANRRAGRGGGSRFPRVVFRIGQESVLDDPVVHARLVRIATMRQYLVRQLQTRINTINGLRSQLIAPLGADTVAAPEGRLQRGPLRTR